MVTTVGKPNEGMTMAFKDEKLAAAYRLLRARGVSARVLADRLHTSRSHVTQVLNGTRRKGRSWDRVKDFLEPEEIALLQECPTRDKAPRGTAGLVANV
jgi:hypothetical protein